MARDFRIGPGASECGEELRPRPGALYRLCLRLGPGATHDVALWDRRPASVLRRRSALPRAVHMKVPERWLRSFCNPSIGTSQLAELLTMSGLEVESREAA